MGISKRLGGVSREVVLASLGGVVRGSSGYVSGDERGLPGGHDEIVGGLCGGAGADSPDGERGGCAVCGMREGALGGFGEQVPARF
jgi:hypothetical protein